MIPGIRDHLNDPDLVDEEDMELDEDFSADLVDEALNEDVISVSPLNYALKMPSPPNNPYRNPILHCDIDLDFCPDFEEGEKAELRKSQGIVLRWARF